MPRLPTDCRVEFHPTFLSPEESAAVYAHLDGIPELKDRRVRTADGKVHETDLGSYILGDDDVLGFDKLPPVWGGRAPWPACLVDIKPRVEAIAGCTFQVGRCIYYEHGDRGVDYHVDLPAYGDTSTIASLSFGEERVFSLRSLEDPEVVYDLTLPDGSLVILGTGCQDRYQHALLRDPEKRKPRFNITFRMYGFSGD